MRIVLCYPVEERHVDQIRRVSPRAEVIDAGQDLIASELLQADIFCGHAKVPVPWQRVVEQGRLRWIQSSAAGMDHCLVDPVIASDIPVTSASGLFADQVAEHAMAMITGMMRRLPVFFKAQQSKEFIRRPTRDLHGCTVGLVGFGGNGRRLAEILRVFNVRILATDMFPVNKPEYVEQLWHADRLHDLVARSDIVVLCVPLNKHTRGMIDAAVFQKMKPNSLLVNVARGPIVVENDLIQAIDKGQVWGAALDVTEQEPLPTTSPLWERSNVLITPHVAAQAAKRVDDTTDFFCDNLRRFLSGRPLANLVDKQLGFPIPTES